MEEGPGSAASSGAGLGEKDTSFSSEQVCAWWADSILLSTVKLAHRALHGSHFPFQKCPASPAAAQES